MKLTLNRKFIQSSVFALGLCLGSASANAADKGTTYNLSLIHISEPTRPY